ncbi:MAG: hypothetical protein L6R41_002571 [Letrouitia leprolyta]|nr:MAG: hypothetical protein L6R41_002571 [Letrouitia leprolyta]
MSEYPVDQSLEPRHTSRAARQRAYLDAQGMEYGSELRAMGKVRTVNGAPHLLYSDQWRPAAYHHELRAELVAAAPPERYVHPPERGIGDNDVTSFWEPHRTWGFATRKDRPKVLFEWLPIIERGMDWPRPSK